MYLRRHEKKADGEEYEYWSLVESVRTARGPRQRIVATIGKLPGLGRPDIHFKGFKVNAVFIAAVLQEQARQPVNFFLYFLMKAFYKFFLRAYG